MQDTYTTGTHYALFFNGPVNSESVASRLTLWSGEEQIPFRLIDQPDDRRIDVEVTADAPQPAFGRLDAGVAAADGDYATLREHRLTVQGMRADSREWSASLEDRNQIALHFSWEVPTDVLQRHLFVDDLSTSSIQSLDYTLTRHSGYHYVATFEPPVPTDVRVRVRLTRG